MTNIMRIEISGPVGIGKSAVMATIRDSLRAMGYCVAIPDRSERNNPSANLDDAAHHEKPTLDSTVIVLTETCAASHSNAAGQTPAGQEEADHGTR